jgi:uncharacterized membrane protein YeaQ/YmgE (transglycosylase-associated protein family)
MYIFAWLVLGGIAGWFASLITKSNRRMGIVMNIIVGLIGSAIGGYICQLVGLGDLSIFTFYGMVFAVLGAVILLTLVNFVRGRSR